MKTLSLISLVLSSSCASHALNLHGKLWQGDSANDRLYRKQDNQAITCGSPLFDQMTCLKTTDLAEYGKACKERGK